MTGAQDFLNPHLVLLCLVPVLASNCLQLCLKTVCKQAVKLDRPHLLLETVRLNLCLRIIRPDSFGKRLS